MASVMHQSFANMAGLKTMETFNLTSRRRMKTKNLFAVFVVIFCHHLVASAQTWKPASPTNLYIVNLAMSADGCKLAIASSGSHAIFSTDSGNTWHTNQTSPVYGTCIASSADGSKLATFSLNNSHSGIYVSTNSGGTWEITSGPNSFNSVFSMSLACSANGNVLIESGSGNYVYVSTNSGLNWTAGGSPNTSWISVASSADGTKLIAAALYQIYTSTNFGSTWTATTLPTLPWQSKSIACSADGRQLIASGYGTYISTNFGSSWRMSSSQAGKVASSADGTRLVIGGNNLFISSDSGVTWTLNSTPVNWSSIASSADGLELMGGIGLNGGENEVWIGRTVPSPQINVVSSNGNFALSWIIPSTNFVLQQSSDLTAENWSNVAAIPVLNLTNLQNQLTLPILDGDAFFRLSTP